MDQRLMGGLQTALAQAVLAVALLYAGTGLSLADDGTLLKLDKSGSLHFREGSREIEVEPAFEDYMDMMFDVCDAMGMTIQSGECSIIPLNGNVAALGVAHEDKEHGKVLIFNRTISPKVGYQGALSIIAHEIGHHYCGHLHKAPSPMQELEADRFSGAAMRRLNYSREDALSATPILYNRPSKSHPERDTRAKWILMGWEKPESAFACR